MQVTVPDGLTAKFSHIRFFSGGEGVLRLYTESWGRKMYGSPEGKGGATTCRLVNEAGEEIAVGAAVCHENDNFDRKLGRTIALGRAVKALNSRRP